jgi:protein O-GlcNAc transferase
MSNQINQMMTSAVESFHGGNFDQTEVILTNILKVQSKNFDALHMMGVVKGIKNQHRDALELFKKALKIDSNNSFLHFNIAKAFSEIGEAQIAIKYHLNATKLNPSHLEGWVNYGKSLLDLNRPKEALELFIKAIDLGPQFAEAWANRGVALLQLKSFEEALLTLDEALKINPRLVEAWSNRGIVLQDLKRYDEALTNYDRAIELKSDYAEAYNNRGIVLQELRRYDEALTNYDRAIELKSDYAEAYNNRGLVLQELKRYDEALTNYDRAIELKSDYAEAYISRGLVLQELKRYDEALTNYDRAIELKSDYSAAYNNRGIVLQQLKRYDEALTNYDRAIELKSDYAEAYNNRGIVLQELKRYDEALTNYDRAIELKSDYAEAYNNRGIVLLELKRYDEALTNYDRAIELKSDYVEAYINRGLVLQELKRYDETLISYDKAIESKPDYEYLFGTILHTKMFICDWRNFEADLEGLSLRINENQKSILSFPILALIDSLSVLHKTSAIWINDKHPINPSIGSTPKNVRRNKIRIGYYSADFHNHATAHLMAELFERHDKNNFELIAFSFGPDTKDEMRLRLSKAFEQFIDVRLRSDKDIALLSRDMEIDVAVDLKGCTKDQRTGIFSYRAAPIQVNYIGFPGTMAAEYIDYIIADPTLIPIESQQHYSEKVVYLPNSYQVNDRQRVISDKVFTKEELGLPPDSFTFCCFNNNYKITPHTFDGWVRILKAVEDSVLWLFEDNPTAAINLRKEAQTKGIDPNRLVFAKRMKLPEHLARHRAADLFIDTLPFNAHTTASDALWAGLPVLTCMGESFASRVAASLLNAIELPELITTTQEQYEATAIELATNPEKLKAIKDKLEKNRLTTALFDTPRFTKHIEAAYTQMYERYLADLLPDHIYIED